MNREIEFRYDIETDPQPEDVGLIIITATVFRESDVPLTFGIEWLVRNLPRCKTLLMFLLRKAGINDGEIHDFVSRKLLDGVAQLACSASNEYTPGCALYVWIDFPEEYHDHDAEIHHEDYHDLDAEIDEIVNDDAETDEDYYDLDAEIDEAAQVSFNETNNIRFRPASKQAVKSLPRKIYNKKIQKKHKKKTKIYKEISLEECTICLEEFSQGGRVVTLPCGHDFDDECIVKWLETSHVCPLCRSELPCESSAT